MKELLLNFLSDEGGQDLVEYSLLLCLIGAVAIVALTAMGKSISAIFGKINERLTDASNQIGD